MLGRLFYEFIILLNCSVYTMQSLPVCVHATHTATNGLHSNDIYFSVHQFRDIAKRIMQW